MNGNKQVAPRAALEGAQREYAVLFDGKPQAMRYQTASLAFADVCEQRWQFLSIMRMVYSAGAWHIEGCDGRFMKDRAGKISPLGKSNNSKALTEGDRR